MIILPATPGPVEVEWQQIDFGGTLTPALGGPTQRLNRLGNRWAARVQLPPMRPADAAIWIASLNKGLREGVRWNVRQVEIVTTGFGTPSPVVDGNGQSGETLAVRGLPAGKGVPWQYVTLISGGMQYLHLVGGTADGAGKVALTVIPPLRVSPADGEAVAFNPVTMEGLLSADEACRWTVDRARRIGLGFTITEQE